MRTCVLLGRLVEEIPEADGCGKARRIKIACVVTVLSIGNFGIGSGYQLCLCGQRQVFLKEVIDAAAYMNPYRRVDVASCSAIFIIVCGKYVQSDTKIWDQLALLKRETVLTAE